MDEQRMLNIRFGDPMRFTCWGHAGCGASIEIPRSEWLNMPYGFAGEWMASHKHEGVADDRAPNP